MPPASVKAIDISNWQGDLEQEVYHRWRAEGVETVIVGTSGNPSAPLVADRQAAKATVAGLRVEAYIWLTHPLSNDQFAARINQKLDLVDSIQLPRIRTIWLDCEDEQNLEDGADIPGQIALARDLVRARGYDVGIYTGRWWWVKHLPPSVAFGIPKLWLAHYDGLPELTSTLMPIGEWVDLYRKQYTDKGSAGGVFPLDLNVEVAPPPPVAADPPVQETTAPVLPMPPEVAQLHQLADDLKAMSQSLHAAAGEIERSWRQ